MKKALIWKLLLVIGLCPFVAPFVYWAIQHIAHERFYVSWPLIDFLIVWSVPFWPTYIIGIILTIISANKLKK